MWLKSLWRCIGATLLLMLVYSGDGTASLFCGKHCQNGLTSVNGCRGVLIGPQVVATAAHCLHASNSVVFDLALVSPTSRCRRLEESGLGLCSIEGAIQIKQKHVIIGDFVEEKLKAQSLGDADRVRVGAELTFIDRAQRRQTVVVDSLDEEGAEIAVCGPIGVEEGDSGGPVFWRQGITWRLVGVIAHAHGSCHDGSSKSIFASVVTESAQSELESWQAGHLPARQICGLTPSAKGCR